MTERPAPREPRLELSVLANGSEAARLYRGEPLVLSVQLVDHEAGRAAAHNEALADAREEIDAREANQELSAAAAKRERAALRQMRVAAIRLGSKKAPWARQVRFSVASVRRVVTWRFELFSNPTAASTADLTGGRVAVAEFALISETLKRVRPGAYVVQASVRAAGKRIVSEPVSVTFTGTAARGRERLRVAIGSARLAYRRREFPSAQEQVERALVVDPHSIDALVLHADVAAAVGRHDVALLALERALTEFQTQYPDSYEPPAPILDRLADLRRRVFPSTGELDPLEDAPPLG